MLTDVLFKELNNKEELVRFTEIINGFQSETEPWMILSLWSMWLYIEWPIQLRKMSLSSSDSLYLPSTFIMVSLKFRFLLGTTSDKRGIVDEVVESNTLIQNLSVKDSAFNEKAVFFESMCFWVMFKRVVTPSVLQLNLS